MLYSADSNGAKSQAFRASACGATSKVQQLLLSLQEHCPETFPACTWFKKVCVSSPECAPCLAMLGAGDGAGAAQRCSGGTHERDFMNSVVAACIQSDTVACSFWHQRCTDNGNCSACLANMGSKDNARAIAAEWSSRVCERAHQDYFATRYLNSLLTGCPGISACQSKIASCVFKYGNECIACINGSAALGQAVWCDRLSQEFSYGTACQPCPASVHTINAVVLATEIVGGVSATACIAVVTTIVAHGRDRVSMRDRIIVGLMLANAVYSTANTIPLNALRSGVLDCGRVAVSFGAIRVGRAWWFCGKYGLVGFELLIIGTSIRALYRGMSAVPPRAEVAMFAACCALAAVALTVFYVLCARINADGYNTSTMNEGFTNAYNHANVNDDLDDSEPYITATSNFQRARDEYDDLVKHMLVAWDVLAGLAIGLWIVLRVAHQRALRELRAEAASAAHAEAVDVWVDTRRSAWEARRRLLEARREAFNDVVKPLELYIVVFVLFAAPAIVMSTTYCQNHSGASYASTAGEGGSGAAADLTYGTCDVWCEFVLAFRSLATVAVYLMSRERFAELLGVRATCRKLFVRVAGCFSCGRVARYSLLDQDRSEWHEMQVIEETQRASDDLNSNAVIAAAGRSRHIDESDIEKVRVLGRGAFGEVWEGILRPDGQRVAIKVMLAAVVDDDGDVVDPYADEDFRKECDALQRIDSPYLLKFFGFGTTASGGRFIVTELLEGGSLHDVLRNPTRDDLPWRTRVKIALQVALGMKHLHERHMLHRDLKSANVLLDELLRAKVCDFGLSRVVRPARQRVVHSPFTGVTRLLLPQVDGVEINDGRQSSVLSSFEDIAVNVLDARGTMTKAAGTLLWMAPEVFRGD
jgi:hypothetical protein